MTALLMFRAGCPGRNRLFHPNSVFCRQEGVIGWPFFSSRQSHSNCDHQFSLNGCGIARIESENHLRSARLSPGLVSSWYSASEFTFQTSNAAPSTFRAASNAVIIE